MNRSTALLAAALAAAAVQPTAAIVLTSDTVAAWNRYVAEAASRRRESGARFPGQPEGQAIDVPGGTIHHWKGSTLVRHSTVDDVVRALMHPGTPPPQEDVLESRVLARNGNTLRVYLKLVRSTIVTVVYDTEHVVTFERQSARLATSQSVSTKIAEAGGGDRGFLWRLNSYWRYTQVGDDVRIDMESISLSRDVPRLVRPVAAPLISRIGRESMSRTLDSVGRFLETSRS